MLVAHYFHLISVVSYRIVILFDARDIARFECACSNRALFGQFRELLARNTISNLTYTIKSAAWILQRNIYPTKVLVDKFVAEADVILFTEVSSSVREIEMREAIISHRAFCILIKHCHRLQKFSACGLTFMSVADYIRIAKSCPALVDLSIHLPLLNRTEFRSILSHCPQLTAIDVTNCKGLRLSEVLADLALMCPKLESLITNRFLGTTSVPQPYLVLADRFPCLNRLHFDRFFLSITLSNECIDSMFGRCAPLVELDLNGLSLSDVTLWRVLHRSPHLRVFRYKGSDISSARVLQLAVQCVELRELDVTCNDCHADRAVTAVAERCSRLHTLALRDCTGCTDAALHAIAAHCTRYLHTLTMLQCRAFGAEAVHSVVRQCSSLRHLHLSRFRLCSSELSEMMSHCPQLTSLELREPYLCIDDSVVYEICAHLKSLKHLHLSGYHVVVSDLAMLHLLSNCPTLHCVHVLNVTGECNDVRIVQAIDEHCPCLRELHIAFCSVAFYNALFTLQSKRAEQRTELVVSASLQFKRGCC